MSSDPQKQKEGQDDRRQNFPAASLEFPPVEADSLQAQNRAAFVAGFRENNVPVRSALEGPTTDELDLSSSRQEKRQEQSVESALEELSISNSRGPGPRPFQSYSLDPSWRPWSPSNPPLPFSDPYGPAPMQHGQMPLQWVPYHPGMSFNMFGEHRQGVFFDPRMQGTPHMYQPQPGFYPTQSLPLQFPGSFSGPRMSAPGNTGPTYVINSRTHVPSIRQRNVRPPKGPQQSSEMYDFSIEEAEQNPDTCRKTLMLRNIPNKYSIHMLLEMLDNSHRKAPEELVYDFVYLPIDFKNRCNLGYAFVNFVEAESALQCYKTFHEKRWNDFNSKKVCEVKYGRVQGREALIEHFKNSKFPSNDRDSLPLLFEQVNREDGSKEIRSVPLLSKQPS